MLNKFFESVDGEDPWDQLDTLAICLYNIRVIKNIGPLKVGELYYSICIDFENGLIEAYENDEDIKYNFKFEIVGVN